MKINNFFLRSVVMTIFISVTTLVFSATGDFGAWTMKTGHGGMSCDKITFTEKSLTLELWLNLDAGTDIDKVIIASTMGDGKTGFALSLRTNSTHSNAIEVRFFVKTPTEGLVPIFIPKEEFVGKWGHMAFVVSEAEGKAYAYINGEPYSSIDAVGGWIGNNTTTALGIGKWFTDPQPYGKIADFRIWNTARTAAEIKANYNKRLAGTEQGLFLYYNFDNFAQTILNVVSSTRNTGSLYPAATWNSVHEYEVLSPMPTNLSAIANTVTWDGTGDSYEIEVSEKVTGIIIKTDAIQVNSYSLSGLNLSSSLAYNIKVRTKKSLFYSDCVTTTKYSPSAVVNPNVARLNIFSSGNGSLTIISDVAKQLNLFGIEGRLVKSITISEGKNFVSGLEKGFYLIDNGKVFVK